MDSRPFPKELKKGSADLLILALLEGRDRHGYEIGRLITERSDGALTYHVASLYPTLYRLEDHGLVEGRWVEKAGQRRRRYYRLTTAGRKRLAIERSVWQDFFVALDRVAGLQRP
jgi:transcriptional regulator